MRKPCRFIRALLLLLLASLSLAGLAQQEDVDTDTATLVLSIERALSIATIGGPIEVTVDVADLKKQFVSLENLRVLVSSLINYQVAAYGTVSPARVDVGVVQLRVEEIIGPFDEILARNFSPLGPSGTPLPLFTGENNVGTGTMARIGLQLDLSRLEGHLADHYTFTVSFMVVER